MKELFKPDKKESAVCFVLFLIAFFVVMSSTYNPFDFRRMHVDSSIYITIAQGITRGALPYKDFVDNKGPLEYLISVPGLAAAGFTGVWLTELLLLCISVFFAYKTALLFMGRKKALTAVMCTFLAYITFFTVCAGTEEYSVPFLTVSLYIFTKYFFAEEKEISIFELVVSGFCFACAVLIRLNMFPLWAGFCAVIIIECIVKRRFAAIAGYISGFCIGILIAAVPVYFYLRVNGIFNAFIEQVVFGGVAKGFSGASIKEIVKNVFTVIERGHTFFPLVTGVLWCITKYKTRHFGFYAAYTVSYILMILFMSFSSGDSHYNLVLVPFFIPAYVFLIEILNTALSEVGHKHICFALLLCVIFAQPLMKYMDDRVQEIFTNKSGQDLIASGKMIDENTADGDKIISLGINGYIYPFTKRNAASKYIYQGSGIDMIPGSREEFLSDITNNKPAVIAIFTAEDDGRYDYLPEWYRPVFDMIQSDYTLLSDKNGYCLFKKVF